MSQSNIDRSPTYACRTCEKTQCECKDVESPLPCHFYVEPVKQEPVHEALQIASVALQDIACSSQTENLYWWQLRARKAQKQIAECLTNAAPVEPVKQELVCKTCESLARTVMMDQTGKA